MKQRISVSRTFWMLCIALLLSFGVAHLQAATPDTATLTATERVERLFRDLPDAKPARRLEIVAELYSFANPKSADSSFSLMYFGYDVTHNSDGTKTLKEKPDRKKVLSRVIPILIDMIDDRDRMECKPWWILISLQGSCPEPKKATWQRWWQETGSKTFKDATR